MLLTTHAGIVVNSDHIACIGLRREVPSPSEPDPEPTPTSGYPEPRFRVLLGMAADGSFIVAARDLTLSAARFVREDIAQFWETNQPHWKARASLKRHAEGAYFAKDGDETSEESEVDNGELSPLSDL